MESLVGGYADARNEKTHGDNVLKEIRALSDILEVKDHDLRLFNEKGKFADGKLAARKIGGYKTLNLGKALGRQAESRIKHFNNAIKEDPKLLKTGMNWFNSRSNSEIRGKMRAVASGLLLCGFDAKTVKYSMDAMRAAINTGGKRARNDLDRAHAAMSSFMKSGQAGGDFEDIIKQNNDLAEVMAVMRHMGSQALPKKQIPAELSGQAAQSNVPATNDPSVTVDQNLVTKGDIGVLQQEAAQVNSDQVNANPNYVEKQSKDLCGKHSANAYLHGNVISEKSLGAFLKLNAFWKDPNLQAIENEEVFDASRGNDPDNVANYLNWLNGADRLAEDQMPLVVERFAGFNGGAELLKPQPYGVGDGSNSRAPKQSHMMYYMAGRGITNRAHFVAFHKQPDDTFKRYDSSKWRPHISTKNPADFARDCLTGVTQSDLNEVAIVRPAETAAEARKALALPMGIDHIQSLSGRDATLMEDFLKEVTVASPEELEEWALKLNDTAPQLAYLARQAIGWGTELRSLPEERQSMRQLVDGAADAIKNMPETDKFQLAHQLGRYGKAQSRQGFAEHIVKQHYPSLSDEQIGHIGTGVLKEMRKDEDSAPLRNWRDQNFLNNEEKLHIARVSLHIANKMYGPPDVPASRDSILGLSIGDESGDDEQNQVGRRGTVIEEDDRPEV